MSGDSTTRAATHQRSYVALSGGIGGAKLCLGLAALLGDRLTIVVNTGDDFEHFGLHISPDIDTTLYTLAGLVNPETGWGRGDETWVFMSSIAELGGPQWFKLGDKDLALHVERTRRLKAGEPLSSVCEHARRCFKITPRILPMSDDPVRTMLATETGTLAFQQYFVREQCRPAVRVIHFTGAETARAQPAALDALSAQHLAGVIICPSNPYLSVDPLLAIPELRAALRNCPAPVVAVTPIIGGKAVKGPTVKIMAELGLASSAATIAKHYQDFIDGFILDRVDAQLASKIETKTHLANTLMRDRADKVALAKTTLEVLSTLTKRVRAQ